MQVQTKSLKLIFNQFESNGAIEQNIQPDNKKNGTSLFYVKISYNSFVPRRPALINFCEKAFQACISTLTNIPFYLGRNRTLDQWTIKQETLKKS